MVKKRKKTTNIKRQLWITLKMTLPTIFLLVICIVTTLHFTKESETGIKNSITVLENSIQTESDMVSAFIKFAGARRSGNLRLATWKIKKDHDKNIDSIRQSIPPIMKTVSDMFIIVYILMAVLVLLVVYLVYTVFHTTNRIYGPVKVMERLLKDAANGEKPFKSNLRKDDDLKPLFAQVYDACNTLSSVVNNDIKRSSLVDSKKIESNC